MLFIIIFWNFKSMKWLFFMVREILVVRYNRYMEDLKIRSILKLVGGE